MKAKYKIVPIVSKADTKWYALKKKRLFFWKTISKGQKPEPLKSLAKHLTQKEIKI